MVIKVERPVGVNGNHHGNDHTLIFLSLGVESLTKVHDIHAMLTERRPHRWRGVRLAGRYLKL